MGLVNELGNSINAANAKALTDMIALGQVAAGQTVTSNDVAIGTYSEITARWNEEEQAWQIKTATGYRDATAEEVKMLDTVAADRKAGRDDGNDTVDGSDFTVQSVDDIVVSVDGEIRAGGLVELQFKIDQMMAAVQEGIKNTGKVSQTREGAARA
ncbi:MAG: hypothetical protein AABZ57_08710 [Candidatus Margulisiibacteriota bacterium]|mgnify:CR=1 FL=1